jgi:hypothetical protein
MKEFSDSGILLLARYPFRCCFFKTLFADAGDQRRQIPTGACGAMYPGADH